MAHQAPEPEMYGLMAEFDSPKALVAAAENARLAGYRQMDAYSPIPIEELEEALGLQRTRLPILVFLGGLFGGLGGYGLQVLGIDDGLHDERRRPAVPQLAAVHTGDV